MKIKQSQIVKAYNAMETIKKNTTLPEATLWELYQLRKALATHYEFQKERENALQDEYSKFADDKGTLSGQHWIDYQNAFNEILNLDKEINWEPIELPVVPGLSLESMEDLDIFITFKKPE